MTWIQHNPIFFRRFSRDARYLVAVSGGRDSVLLLHWLIERGYNKLTVCHLNHLLRGRSSDADARFVEQLVAKYNGRMAEEAFPAPNSEPITRTSLSASATLFVREP